MSFLDAIDPRAHKAFHETQAHQQSAADPRCSAFVSANAGAGKTRVLTNRVARLLLTGADPARILCITFTKAAAAEMAERLFSLLGEWALLDNEALERALGDLEGRSAPLSADALRRARRLFARALETPGGLKIQTIHSFCESVLKRFPIEAGVTPGFTVMDDKDAAALSAQVIGHMAVGASCVDGPAKDLARLTRRLGPAGAMALFETAFVDRQAVLHALDGFGGWEGLAPAARRALGVETDNEESALAALDACVGDAVLTAARDVLRMGGLKANELADGPLTMAIDARMPDARRKALADVFLTKSRTPRKHLADAKARKANEAVIAALNDAQQAYLTARAEVERAGAWEDACAFYRLLEKTYTEYEARKDARAALDYDDLIMRTRALFQNHQDNAWVMYKLDGGIDHILLDEAQDTAPSQWDIVEAPLREFVAGLGARDTERTFFAVGDQKQSIYSFQGADAGLFSAKKLDLAKQFEAAGAGYRDVPLALSFRTTAPVLNFVDALFDGPAGVESLGLAGDEPVAHEVLRLGAAGSVALWPLTPFVKPKVENAWDAPIDWRAGDNPTATLCASVAEDIRERLNSDEVLSSTGRPAAPGDFMLLVQARSGVFHDVIAALTRAGVPVAGADKFNLLDDQAVADLLSYARVALMPQDDLSMAELLKSPFFGVSDAALFDLAYARSGALEEALEGRRTKSAIWDGAYGAIEKARRIALHEGAFAFFQHILDSGAPSGKQRLFERLSRACEPSVDELLRLALAFERVNPKSLQGFLSWAQKHAGEIKREPDKDTNAVRVMTVHGAKGLEAPVVYVIDANRQPNLGQRSSVLYAPAPDRNGARTPVVSRGRKTDPASLQGAHDDAYAQKLEEHKRLLYVASTRARDHLIICGVESGRYVGRAAPDAWYGLVENAFERLSEVRRTPHPAWAGDIQTLSSAQELPITSPPSGVNAKPQPPPQPDWLFRPAAHEEEQRRLAPSRLADELEAEDTLSGAAPAAGDALRAAYSPLAGKDAYRRGRVLHRLLELLPGAPAGALEARADRLLARYAADIPYSERLRWRSEVFAIFDHPEFASAFGPESRPEVAVSGDILVENAARAYSIRIDGRIDRLAVFPDRVLAIDFKTNRPPPRNVEETPDAYLAQMAAYRALLRVLYPDRPVTSALLWTFEARLTPLPDALLDHAFARFVR